MQTKAGGGGRRPRTRGSALQERVGRSLTRFEKGQYLAVVRAAQFRKAVMDKLHHLMPVEFVLLDGLRDESEAGLAAGLYQLLGAVGPHPDIAGFLNGRLQHRERRVAIGPVDRIG